MDSLKITYVDVSDIKDVDDGGYHKALELNSRAQSDRDSEVRSQVGEIISSVRRDGDSALLHYSKRFDRLDVTKVAELEVSGDECRKALDVVSVPEREALEYAAERIKHYHLKQKQESWQFVDEDGNTLGQRITPIEQVGVYVPGGKAAYPSSVLMNTVPAKVAGVSRVVMTVPAPDNHVNPLVLAAASIVGVDQVFKLGGAQAIAALAYGTQSIVPVDKIVGPGNAYVAEAKRQVFGKVGIDMFAGPSEILVICDGKTDPEWVAMDLFSQAEHDEEAQAVLVSPDAAFLKKVEDSMRALLPEQQRAPIIAESISNRGLFVHVKDLDQAIDFANAMAPEHLELSFDDAESLLPKIFNAGAIFLGRHTPEAFGDYCAGPNHVLPTSGTARFASPLGVYDFQKKSSIINCSPKGASKLGAAATVMATGEGLQAHADSARCRMT